MYFNRLNKKKKGVHLVEEPKQIVNGQYIGRLNHSNVILSSIQITTKPNKEGDIIVDYTTAQHSEKDWVTNITIKYHTDMTVYVHYETEGDVVDADDVNFLQDEIKGVRFDNNENKNEIKIIKSQLDEVPGIGDVVTSVNGEKGDVILDGKNIEYSAGDGYSLQDVIAAEKERLDGLSEVVVESGNSMSGSISDLEKTKWGKGELRVGGSNLSHKKDYSVNNDYMEVIISGESIEGNNIYKVTKKQDGTPPITLMPSTIKVNPGESFTINLWINHETVPSGSPAILSFFKDKHLAKAESKLIANEWQMLSATYKNETDEFVEPLIYFYPARSKGEVTLFHSPTLVRGNAIKHWTPSTKDIRDNLDMKWGKDELDLGGRNYLLDSAKHLTNDGSSYYGTYALTKNSFTEGDKITLSIITSGETQQVSLYAAFTQSNAYPTRMPLIKREDGVYYYSGPSVGDSPYNNIYIYQTSSSPSDGVNIIKAKLEAGGTQTPWVPAPEDVGETATQNSPIASLDHIEGLKYELVNSSKDMNTLSAKVVEKVREDLFRTKKHSSRNLFDGLVEHGTFQYGSGNKTPHTTRVINTNPIEVTGGKNIVIKAHRGNAKPTDSIQIWEYDKNMKLITNNDLYHFSRNSILLESATRYINFRTLGSEMTLDEVSKGLQIEYGVEPTAYEPYYNYERLELKVTPENLPSKLIEVQHLSDDIQSKLFKDDVSIKESYEYEMMSNVIRKCQLIQDNSNVFTFGVITDTHVAPDNVHFTKSLGNLGKDVPMSFIAHLGDIIDGQSEKFIELDRVSLVRKNLSRQGVPAMFCKGNHDDNFIYASKHGGLAKMGITNLELYNRTNRFIKDEIVGNGCEFYFYTDDEDSRIRTIFLNTQDHPYIVTDSGELKYWSMNNYVLSEEQLKWIANEALNFTHKNNPEEWAVVLCGHILGVAGLSRAAALNVILKAYIEGKECNIDTTDQYGSYSLSANFQDQGNGEVIAMFHGHRHLQESHLIGGIRTIGFLNSQPSERKNIPGETAPERVIGTPSENAWQVVNIDRNARKIKIVGFGAATDWEVSY